jgi:hypothetical protein
MPEPEPFRFVTERHLIQLTGLKARNLPELLRSLETAPGASIFHHTHSHYLSHNYEKPFVYNEFAEWISHALQEKRLAEQLAAVDLFSFTSIRQLRERLVGTVSNFLQSSHGRLREAPPGDEFYFAKSKSFVMPTKYMAMNLDEFRNVLPHLTIDSLYFHFFEARLRLEKPSNDFSAWLYSVGESGVAKRIEGLNPYDYTLDELKAELIVIAGEEEVV